MSSEIDNAKLAQRLRECAAYVEHNEFHPQMYQVLADLHTYSGKHSGKSQQVSKGSASAALGASFGSLSKKLGKISLTGSEKDKRHATSSKNAQRVKQDLVSDLGKSSSGEHDDSWAAWWANSTETKAAPAKPGKPAFQRPTNPKSTLIANGWIEQQRRSKMRVVWKDVLASLVEGRKPGEETTLWIQREVTNSTTGKPELEALHQVPIKWLKEVQYLDFYGDHRFNIKVFNVAEEFQFRCADADAAQNWVLTLQSVKEIDDKKRKAEASKLDGSTHRLDASSHSTTSPTAAADRTSPVPAAPVEATAPAAAAARTASPPVVEEQAKPRMTVKEMRAVAHGAGINTHGMERADLERVVLKVQGLRTSVKTDDTQHQQEIEAARRRLEAEHQEELLRKAESAEKDEKAAEDKRHQIDEEQRKRVAAARLRAEEEEKRRQAADDQQRAAALAEERRRVEEQRRQQAIVEDQRRQAAAAEARRVAEARRAQEAQQRYQQQQQQWQQQQAAQQQWQQQQAAAQQRAQAAQQAQWQQWQQQRQQQPQQAYAQQQQHSSQSSTNGHQQHAQPQQQRPAAPSQTSTADLKYTKMAKETEGSSEEKVNHVKKNILTHWALQPPALSHLRQIGDLLTTIHNVFPPAFGVAGHDYFSKWTPLKREELIPIGGGPDEDKLKKAVRKLRFFLHPDKLPRDLDEQQQFMCKMLWDISSDAWEEFKKRKEDLDWIKS